MNEEKIKGLFSDEEFVKYLFESKSFEEAQAKLAAKDIDVSVDELKKAYKLIQMKQSGELSDEELEEVAGGMGVTFFVGFIIGVMILVGGGGGAAGIVAMEHC